MWLHSSLPIVTSPDNADPALSLFCSPVNPGYCPQVDPNGMTICLVECNSDRQCGLGRKCCSQGCHVYCMWAEPGNFAPGSGGPKGGYLVLPIR